MPEGPKLGQLAQAVADDLRRIGFCGLGEMGPRALTPRDVLDWSEINGARLPAWWANALVSASAAYLAACRETEGKTCPPPWREQTFEEAEEAMARALRG